ncbi:MAG: hypothetical protein GXO85_03920 [Chlorobi bacterium]|nr:hypothetical protein [Chlorobiota bacterium]
MKKVIKIIFLILILSVTLEAQLVIKNPKYGFSTAGNLMIKNIEITDDATILYFNIDLTPGQWFLIPDETYIQVVDGGEKLFITDSKE